MYSVPDFRRDADSSPRFCRGLCRMAIIFLDLPKITLSNQPTGDSDSAQTFHVFGNDFVYLADKHGNARALNDDDLLGIFRCNMKIKLATDSFVSCFRKDSGNVEKTT